MEHERPVHLRHKPLDDGQAKAGTGGLRRSSRKPGSQLLQDLSVDSRSFVCHANQAPFVHVDRDDTGRRAMNQGVFDQIADNDPESIRIGGPFDANVQGLARITIRLLPITVRSISCKTIRRTGIRSVGVGTRAVRNRTLRANGMRTYATRRSTAGRRSDRNPFGI